MSLYGLGRGVVGLEVGWWGVLVDEEMGLFRFLIIESSASLTDSRTYLEVEVMMIVGNNDKNGE